MAAFLEESSVLEISLELKKKGIDPATILFYNQPNEYKVQISMNSLKKHLSNVNTTAILSLDVVQHIAGVPFGVSLLTTSLLAGGFYFRQLQNTYQKLSGKHPFIYFLELTTEGHDQEKLLKLLRPYHPLSMDIYDEEDEQPDLSVEASLVPLQNESPAVSCPNYKVD